MPDRLKGILMAAGSASLWGLMGIFTRVLGAAGYTSLDVAYLRCLLAGVGLLVFHGLRNPRVLRVEPRGIGISLLFGAATYTVGFLSYAFAVRRIPVAMAAVLSFMSPVWVCLIGLAVFRERVEKRQAASIALCLAGAVMITDLPGGGLRFDALGMLGAVMNGVGIAVQVSVPRYFADRYQRDTMLAYGFTGAAAFMALFAGHGRIIRGFSGPGGWAVLGSVLALGIPCTLIANSCFVKSSCYIKPAAACILSALEVVVSTIVGVLLFRETMTPVQMAGGVIVVAASLGMELLDRGAPPSGGRELIGKGDGRDPARRRRDGSACH